MIKDHELRPLQTLLSDYINILNRFGLPHGIVKSSFVKELIVKEFGQQVGFHNRGSIKSEIVYSTEGSSSYVEAALLATGLGEDELIKIVTTRLKDEVVETGQVKWPPSVEDLEGDEQFSPLLVKILQQLSKTKEVSIPFVHLRDVSLALITTVF